MSKKHEPEIRVGHTVYVPPYAWDGVERYSVRAPKDQTERWLQHKVFSVLNVEEKYNDVQTNEGGLLMAWTLPVAGGENEF